MGKQWVGLTAVFLIVLAARLYFAFQTPFYTSDSAYLHERSVENILNGKILWHDPLGYSGRAIVASPLFDIILALFAVISPVALKIIPNIFASILVIPAYLIAHRLTKSTTLSLVSALLASLVPAFFANTFNHLSPLTLALPLFFFLSYTWLRGNVITFLALLLVFVFLSPLSIIFVLSIGVYFALLAIEQIKPRIAEYELGLFSVFFTLWAQFLLYKKLILFHGPAAVWQNIPAQLLSAFYSNVTILGAIAQIGVFPLVDGMYALYKTAFKEPHKDTLMLFSIVTVSALTLWLKLVNITTGFILLGTTLAILFSKSLLITHAYLNETKIKKYAWTIIIIFIIFSIVSTGYPAYIQAKSQLSKTITREEAASLEMLRRTTPETATIIAPHSYGNYITAIAQRKNIIDTYFFLQPNINERYEDVVRLYKTNFETEAVELFDKYNATHIIIPHGTKDISYGDTACFKRIQATNPIIYEKDESCELKVVS